MAPRYVIRSLVSFAPKKVGEGQWEIRLATPAGEILYILGFQTKEETEAWLNSDRRREWLEARGWEHWDIDPPKPGTRWTAD